ncbi:MAG: glycosyltransferase [Ilumatobacteraceae bacterium]
MSTLPIIIAIAGIVAISWALWRPRTLATTATTPTTATPETPETPETPATVGVSAQWSHAPGARLAVIIPARDEADNLPALFDCLARSEVRPHEVIVVDDGSSDDTAAIAAHEGAEVVPAGRLPAGWAGKPHACALGVAHSTGDVLVFLDADVRLSSSALGLVLAELAARGGLVSVQPHHRPASWIEQLSAVFNVCAVAGSGAFTAGADRADGAGRIAYGPCLAISRNDYLAVGGHAGVSGSVIEDIALARALEASGRSVSALLGGDDLTYRMYPSGWRAMVQGWTKNIARGAARAPLVPVLATVAWVAAMVATTIATVSGVVHWIAGGGVPWPALVAYAAIAVHAPWVLRRVGSFHVLTALLFPIPVVFFVLVFLRSMSLAVLRRPVRWRGRVISPSRGAP